MNFEKRTDRTHAALPDDATEVLSPSSCPQQGTGDDATLVLPAQRYDRAENTDATAVLPVSGQGCRAEPFEADTKIFDAADTAVFPDIADTTEQPSTAQPAFMGSRLLSALATQGKRTADRVKKERAARKAEKGQKVSSTPTSAPAAPGSQQLAPQASQHNPGHLMFGGRMGNQRSQPYPFGSQVAPATSAENSPSGKLHMLTPSHIRQTRPSLWTLLQHFFAAGTMVFLLIAAIVFFITTPTGQQLDETSFQEFSYQFMLYTQQTSSLLDMIPAAAGAIAAVGILFVLIWKHRFVPALVGLGMAIGANITTQLLKNYFIVKPNLGLQEAAINSAPSGHTTFAAAAGLAVFLASPKRFRPTVALFSMVFTVAAGYATVVNGWHRPSDVVAAILVTGLWSILGLIILRFMRSEELDMSDTQRSGLILVPLLTITGFFVAFCAFSLYCVTWFNPIPGSSFVAAVCMIAAVAALTTSMQIALLRPQNKQRSAYRRVWVY